MLTSDKRLMLGRFLWRKSTIITSDGYHRTHLLIHALRLTSLPLPLTLSFILMVFSQPAVRLGWRSVNTGRKYVYFKKKTEGNSV